MTSTWYCDTEEELNEQLEELDNNPDFTFIGSYNLIQDIYSELNYQGLKDTEIDQLTMNRYGNCLEIIEHDSNYYAFIGAR